MRFVECMMIMFGFRLSDKLMNVFAVFLCMCALMVILFFQAIVWRQNGLAIAPVQSEMWLLLCSLLAMHDDFIWILTA